MAISIDAIHLMRDGFGAPMDWNTDVIGLNVSQINIQISASGASDSAMPSEIDVEVVSRPPNRASGTGTVASALTWSVPRHGPDPANPASTLYRLARDISDAGDFFALRTGRPLEVSTVVRPGGTSDAVFRSALGWETRGIGQQPSTSGSSTGAMSAETPDALVLMKTAGVEVLDVTVVPEASWTVHDSHSWRLIRSPADIVYYSGHGLSASNCLAIEPPTGSYSCWATASDLTPHWKSPMDLDVFIIAGCSVLAVDFSGASPSGPGLDWAKLLTTSGGPITALLGYGGSAPLDSRGGDDIARDMAGRIAGGSRTFVADWLDINGSYKSWNAVAMDARGYWSLTPTRALGVLWSTGFTVNGPTTLP